MGSLLSGEFVLGDWAAVGLNVQTAVKRGIFTVDSVLVLKKVGSLSERDLSQLEQSLRAWLGL
jgi:mRNA interferase MazF